MKVSSSAERPGLFDSNFSSQLSSRQQMSKLEANRLESQWKKICDHEKRSKERNKELLKDFERVEQHAAMLAVKTERLKAYKEQYESYINNMYPRWKEELENYRLSQQQNRNGSAGNGPGATQIPLPSSLRAAKLEPHFAGNSPLSTSTPAHPHSSMPSAYDRSQPKTSYPSRHLPQSAYDRSPPKISYPADRQHPYNEFSYHESSHPHSSSLPPSGFFPFDVRGQTPGFHDSQRHLDSRIHQGQFAASGREPENVHYRSPDHYFASPGDRFYDRRPHSGEVAISRNGPPASGYMYPDIPHGQSQVGRQAAPYEPRTELQRTFLEHRNYPGPYEQNGYHERYYHDRAPGGHRGYTDHRPATFEPHTMERGIIVNGRDEAEVNKAFGSGLSTRPVVKNVQESAEDAKHLPLESHPTSQPFVHPEKPLERNNPVSSLPNPSLSSTVLDSSVESTEQGRHYETKEDESVISPTSSQATPNLLADTPEKEYVLKHQSLPRERLAEVSEKPPKLDVKPVKSVDRIKDGPQERLEVKSVDAKIEERMTEVPVMPQEPDKLKDLSDDEESLDLSDLSLPDGGDKGGISYVPSQMEHKRASTPEKDVALRRDLGFSASPSDPVVEPGDTKSITEDISEEIPESVPLENDEDAVDAPLHDEIKETLPSTGKKVTEQSGRSDAIESVKDGKDENIDEVLDNVETEIQTQMTLEERKPSVSVDGFLCLLQAVDADVEVSFSPETLYHSPSCSSDMREEIIRAAEVGSSLQSFDPNTVSMIVLEELPLLVSSSSAGCLIPDRVFSEGVSCESEKDLRPLVETSLIKLWKELFSHLVNVVKNNVMSAEEVGNTFGTLIISQSSKYWKESQLLLCRILRAAVSDVSSRSPSPPVSPLGHDLDLEPRFESEEPYKQEDDKASIASEASSSTLGSTPPKMELNKSKEENRKPTPEPTVSYEDDFEDDVPLTQSAAYLRMMSSAQSEPDDDISDPLGNSGPQKQESEADEDVERELARSISPPVTSPRQRSPSHSKSGKQKPKLSLFETDAGGKADKDLGDSWGGSSLKSVKSDISDSESIVSPPLSPDGVIGYTPTAVENQQQKDKVDKDNDKSEPKSVTDTKAKRKTDFWNTSDTESEVDLQLSTGGMDQEDDDFDFYG